MFPTKDLFKMEFTHCVCDKFGILSLSSRSTKDILLPMRLFGDMLETVGIIQESNSLFFVSGALLSSSVIKILFALWIINLS